MRLLFKLLRKNVNFWQLAGFALANLVGAVIVLFGIQAYKDAAQVLKSPDSVMSKDILVLSKPVSAASTIAGALGARPRSFSEEEIEKIAAIDGVTSTGVFRMAQFSVMGGITYGQFTVSTEMFIESVPDKFLDVDLRKWQASLDDYEIPVIIPRAYLSFYNYGFAASRGTPQLGEELFSKVPFNMTFRTREGRKDYIGRIVGLTDRMNTILVPDAFLEEANLRYSNEPPKSPTRVLVEAGTESPAALIDYINENDYVIDGGSEDTVKLLAIVRTIITIVVAIGLLVSSLAFFLLLISILLLIEKNRYKNDTLHQLGYPDRMIALPYQTLAVSVDVFVWVVATVITLMSYPVVATLMKTISPDFEPGGPGLVLLSCTALCLVFAITHILLIRFKIRSK